MSNGKTLATAATSFLARGVEFEARKGDVFWIEIWSERLGFPSDAFAVMQRVDHDGSGAEKLEDVQEFTDQDTNLGGNGQRQLC